MRLSTYHRLAAELYGHEDPALRRRILEFYLGHAAGARAPYREPMCGTGYFLIPFLKRGADIDGLDASKHMLAVCREQCARRGLRPALYQRVLPDLDLPRRYGYIFIPDRSFGLLCDED